MDDLIHHLKTNAEDIKNELLVAQKYPDMRKDILIVVKDQYHYIKACIDSIFCNTEHFKLYIWDNASQEPAKSYLEELGSRDNVNIYRSEENLGFIRPNNFLAAQGDSQYLILLNSDTIVKPNWDRALISWMKEYPDVAATGYAGSKLNDEFQGGDSHFGYNVDYICGWCLALSRNTFNQLGLFDEDNLDFCYGEDSDLSLRIIEDNKRIYALRLGLVHHFGNITVKQVAKESDLTSSFTRNHEYLKRRWGNLLGK